MIKSHNSINYNNLINNSVRIVIIQVLYQIMMDRTITETNHIYLTFSTQYPGLVLPAKILTKYPRDITIAFQNQFKDLTMFHDRFEVYLTFNGVESKIVVPFQAIIGFNDTNANIVLKCESPELDIDDQLDQMLEIHNMTNVAEDNKIIMLADYLKLQG